MDNVNEFLQEIQSFQKCFVPVLFDLTVRWDSKEDGRGGAYYFSHLTQEQLNVTIATITIIASNRKIVVSMSYIQTVMPINPYR